MNLAGNISDIDIELDKLTKSLSKYYITDTPEDVPEFDKFMHQISLDNYLKEVFPTVEEMHANIKEIRYFFNKTERLEHKVLVVSFHKTDYYFIQKDDGAISVSTAPYLYEETAVQLREHEFSYYSED